MDPSPANLAQPVGAVAGPANMPGITPQQLEQYRLAELRAKKIRRAVAVANTDGGIGAVLAVTAIMSVCFDKTALLIGPALGVIAWNSFRGAKKLRKFDPAAPGILAWNQLFLAAAIIVYCLLSLLLHFMGGSGLAKELADNGINPADAAQALGVDPIKLDRMFYIGFYSFVMLATIVFQGLTGLYYLSRKKLLAQYLEETPSWVVDMQKVQAH